MNGRGARWAWSRWWRERGAITFAAVGGGAALLLVGSLGTAVWQARWALQNEPWAASRASPAGADAPQTSVPALAAPDFSANLPAQALMPGTMAVVQDAAHRSGVSIESTQMHESAPTGERLGRGDLIIAARGPYSALKRSLAEILDRAPAATVSQLQMQRAVGAADLEARVTLRVWSRPAALATDR